jgi:hypothetical protein
MRASNKNRADLANAHYQRIGRILKSIKNMERETVIARYELVEIYNLLKVLRDVYYLELKQLEEKVKK